MTQWNIQQLNIQRIKDLDNCQDDSERGMCNAICKKEILALATSKHKLTGVDIAILNSLFDPAILNHHGISI